MHGFRLGSVWNWILTRENIVLEDEGKTFAPGGLDTSWTPGHTNYINHLRNSGKKLRYLGALVTDINHILLKQGGLFTYPALKDKPEGKLRMLFELQPLAYLVEQAGGMATDGVENILDKVPEKLDERSPIYIGSKKEVELAREYLTS